MAAEQEPHRRCVGCGMQHSLERRICNECGGDVIEVQPLRPRDVLARRFERFKEEPR